MDALNVCEVPADVLELVGGVPFECQPPALPWRYARHLLSYLALGFFDGTLNGDAGARANLAPERLAAIEDLTWQPK